jgi:hypothetical protein
MHRGVRMDVMINQLFMIVENYCYLNYVSNFMMKEYKKFSFNIKTKKNIVTFYFKKAF